MAQKIEPRSEVRGKKRKTKERENKVSANIGWAKLRRRAAGLLLGGLVAGPGSPARRLPGIGPASERDRVDPWPELLCTSAAGSLRGEALRLRLARSAPGVRWRELTAAGLQCFSPFFWFLNGMSMRLWPSAKKGLLRKGISERS